MTPQRKAYLAKCSKKELWYRKRLFELKASLKTLKILATAPENSCWLENIKFIKWEILVLRHELARLKGLDRVVVPEVYKSTGVFHCSKCNGAVWLIKDNYCPNCGRRILW